MGPMGQGESKDGGKEEANGTPGAGTNPQGPDGKEAQGKAMAKTRGASLPGGTPVAAWMEKVANGQGQARRGPEPGAAASETTR